MKTARLQEYKSIYKNTRQICTLWAYVQLQTSSELHYGLQACTIQCTASYTMKYRANVFMFLVTLGAVQRCVEEATVPMIGIHCKYLLQLGFFLVLSILLVA